MNSLSEMSNAGESRGEPHAGLRTAVAALLLSVVVIGAGIVGTILCQRDRDRDGSGKMAPSQSEPDAIAEGESVPQPAAADRHVKLVVHDDRTPDAEQLDEDLDELERAEAAAARGEWSQAAKAYARITMDPPVPLHAWYHYAVACLKTGDQAGYREICESMLDRVELDPFNLPPINLVAWMCAMAPEAVADSRRPVVLADLILPRLPDDPTLKHAYLNTIGGVYLRAGRHKEAVTHLKEAIAATEDGGAKQDWLLLSLAYHHLGRPAEARRCLTKMPTDSALNRRDSVWDRAEIELLEAEVQRTISPR
jgi:tetratricopeptide (TPR) repeat protein